MANRKAPEQPASANPAPSLTPEALKKLIAEVIAETTAKVRAEVKAEMQAKPASDQSAKNLLKTVAAFKKKGFGTVVPHQDVKTFNRWISEGLRPREGEKSIAVSNLRLFHRSQCRPLSKDEAAAFKAKAAEQAAKRSAKSTAKVIPIGEQHPA